jgi:hypothetical protein
MRDLFSGTGQSQSSGRRDSSYSIPCPLQIDPWVASSLLQKAIRRGDVELAERAAITLHLHRGSGIWRRFLIIAFEDVGIGSVAALINTVVAATNRAWRTNNGGDEATACLIARSLVLAPKDRSPDHLIGSAWSHPALEETRVTMADRSLVQRLELVADISLPLPMRAMAAWHSSGIEWGRERRVGTGNLTALMSAFQQLGVPTDFLEATRRAAIKTREPIVIMAPLLWLAAGRTPAPSVVKCSVPTSPTIDGVPMYAFDKHTALGKAAIHQLARENEAVRGVLSAYVRHDQAREAACMAAFYADAAPVSLRLDWKGSAELEALGIENDMLRAGVPLEGIEPILTVVRDNLDHLNAIRAKRFSASRRSSKMGA